MELRCFKSCIYFQYLPVYFVRRTSYYLNRGDLLKNKFYISILIMLLLTIIYQFIPDYKIVNSRVTMSDYSRDVEINAVAYKFWIADKIADAIVEEHTRINVTPTSMIINIHIFKLFIFKGYEPYAIVEVYFEEIMKTS